MNNQANHKNGKLEPIETISYEADPDSTSSFLTCHKCHKTLSFDDFVVFIVLHGLIFLDNPSVFIYGCTCRYCKEATLIKKFPKKSPLPEEIAELYNCISKHKPWTFDRSPENCAIHERYFFLRFSGEWKYNSFPYHFIHPRDSFVKSDYFELYFSEVINNHYKEIIDHYFPHLNQSIPFDEVMQNFFFPFPKYGVDTPPFSLLFGYKEDEIDELIAFENKHKKKVFPRHTLDNKHLEAIQSFCWIHNLQRVFSEKGKYPISVLDEENILMKSNKLIAQKKYQFLKMLDQEKYQLHIFDLLNFYPDSEPERLVRWLSKFHNLSITQILHKKNSDKKDFGILGDNYEKLRRKQIAKVWEHFDKKYIQEMILIRAEKFIAEFIELSKSISFSRNLIWEIRDKYLFELYNAITSIYQRKIEQKKDDKFWHEKAEEAEKSFPEVNIISRHRSINKIKIHISNFKKVVDADLFNGPVLLLGERGTGKSLFAKAIHYALKLPGIFQVVDCGAKSENVFESELFGHVRGAFTGADRNRKGAFETASGGTIFLDEIGNIKEEQQKKLLRVLQDRKYEPLGSSMTKTTDAFIIAATNADLEQMVENGEFRGDLFDRLHQEPIKIPPLRERKKDIPLFFKHLKTKIPIDSDIENDLMKLNYDWPGNVRELISTIERIERRKIMEDDNTPISFDDLSKEIVGIERKPEIKRKKKLPGRQKFTDEELLEAMAKFNNVKKLVAEELESTPKTIWLRWKKLQSK